MSANSIKKIKNNILALEKISSLKSKRGKTKAIREIFSNILTIEGYKPASYMSYYLYIAENDNHESIKTIGVIFNDKTTTIDKEEVENWIYSGTLKGIDKIILFTNASFAHDAFDFENIYDPVRLELKNLSDIKTWVSSIEADYDETQVTKLIRACIRGLIELIAEDPKNTLAELEWRDIERVVAELFKGLGFNSILTPPSKDGGKDVIVELTSFVNNQSYIIEIKHWRSRQKVGVDAIEDFIKVVGREKRDGGLFLSTYGYTENILEGLAKIEKKNIRYGDEQKIHSLCTTYLKRKSGIWMEDLDLKTVLFDKTQSF